MKWIRQFMILLAVTLLGEILRALIPFAIPAGIYGLVILFLCLCFGVIKLDQVEGAADFLIEIMPLCFIPAGVGLMTRWAQLQSLLLPVLISLFAVTILVMAATGFATQYLVRRKEKREGREDA